MAKDGYGSVKDYDDEEGGRDIIDSPSYSDIIKQDRKDQEKERKILEYYKKQGQNYPSRWDE